MATLRKEYVARSGWFWQTTILTGAHVVAIEEPRVVGRERAGALVVLGTGDRLIMSPGMEFRSFSPVPTIVRTGTFLSYDQLKVSIAKIKQEPRPVPIVRVSMALMLTTSNPTSACGRREISFEFYLPTIAQRMAKCRTKDAVLQKTFASLPISYGSRAHYGTNPRHIELYVS